MTEHTPSTHVHSAHQAAVENLLSLDDASHVAVRDGDWTDPNTWADGQVPGSEADVFIMDDVCLLYTSPSPRDRTRSRMPSSA